jgi:sulfide:quinone oxidoreductase
MTSVKAKIVILGGGFAGLRALYRLRALGDRADIVLIDPRTTSLARPALPEVAFAGKPVEHARFPLERPVTRSGARFMNQGVERIEANEQRVVFDNGDTISYDYLFLGLGAKKDYDAIGGFHEFGYSICDDTEAPRLAGALAAFKGGPVVVGTAKSVWGTRVDAPMLAAPCEGPVAEIMFMVGHDLRLRGLHKSSAIRVFSPGDIFFEDVGTRVHADVGALIAREGIEVTTGKVLSHLEEGAVVFEDGDRWESALSIVLPPYRGNDVIVRSTGLGDEQGFVPTDTTMRHLDFERIVAAGDATALSMPKLGHIAVMQADIASATLIRDVTGEGEIPEFRPEVFCIANRGGEQATLIYSNDFFGGPIDLTMSGAIAHMMKWGFDEYYFHTAGHLPPDLATEGLELVLRELRN